MPDEDFHVSIAVDLSERKAAEEGLQYQLDLTTSITNNATTAIFMMDETGRCVFMNPAAEKMTLFTLGEVQEGSLHDYIHHHHPDGSPFPKSDCPIDHSLPNEFELINHEDEFIRKNGEFFPVLVNAKPILRNGEPAGTIIEVRDTTEERRRQEEIRRRAAEAEEGNRILGAIMKHVPEGITIADAPDVEIRMVSEYGMELLKRPRETVVGIPDSQHPKAFSIFHADGITPATPEELPLSRAVRKGEVVRNEEWLLRPGDGINLPLLCSAGPIRNQEGSIVGGIIAWRDISELKLLYGELQDADRRKDEFLAILAHELRNPLAPIKYCLELLNNSERDSETFRHAKATMERQVSQMVRLVDDLLDVSRITRNKLELRKEKIDLSSVLHQALEAIGPACNAEGHQLEVSIPGEPFMLYADSVRLVQVFCNLLNNACKYTRKGGRISVTVEQHGNEVSVRIKDNGIGIPAEMLPKVFDLFTQVDRSLERAEGGLGIGLSLVKVLVEMHGGTVIARSQGLDHGSEFEVRLPITLDESASPDTGEVEVRLQTVLRILIVDDNLDGATSLAMLLQMAGNETAKAFDGREAIEKAAEFCPDVILLDIGLPKLNGYEVCKQIRQQAWGKDIKIFALTGWGQEEDRRKSQDAGFDGHSVKPVNHHELINLLRTFQDSTGNE